MKRKLTTILFADAQGYSALMATDETATLERLNRYRAIMAGLFERHDGRQVNTWGDAVIAEFTSVVEAVRCAVEIQDSLTAENQRLRKQEQMWFRIGINLGDVMVDDDNLYGDGVNVAQRLEASAEPGGIMVSGTVHSFVHKQLAIAFDFAGEQDGKNGGDRVTTYRVRMADRNLADAADAKGVGDEVETPVNPSGFVRSASQLEAIWDWLSRQPRRVRFSAFMIAFFFAINLLFGGIGTPWFVFPSAPFALYIFLRVRRERERSGMLP